MKIIKKNIQMLRDGTIKKQLALLKEDIDLYACRLEYDLNLAKGYKNYSYMRKFLKLFFGRNCFRYVLYFRLDPFSRFVSFFSHLRMIVQLFGVIGMEWLEVESFLCTLGGRFLIVSI